MANIRTGRRSGLVLRGGRNRRESLWFDIGASRTVLAAANSAALTNGLSAAGLALAPFTIVRTRLFIHVKSDQTGASEDYLMAVGLAIISEQAGIIGVTAIPTPFSDMESDLWFLHDIIGGSFTFVSGVGFQDPSGTMKSVDSKAMRKIEDGNDLALVIENSGLAASGVTVTLSGRILIKLH